MKFGKTLLAAQVPEWSWNYISYKLLKQQITVIEEAQRRKNAADVTDKITAFFFAFDRELEKVNGFYVYKKTVLERRMRILLEKYSTYTMASENSSADSDYEKALLSSLKSITDSIHKTLRFAELNSSGFRKILKKFDKRTGKQITGEHLKKITVLPFFDSHEFDQMLEDIDMISDSIRSKSSQQSLKQPETAYYPKLEEILRQDDVVGLKSLFDELGLKPSNSELTAGNSSSQAAEDEGIVLTRQKILDKNKLLQRTLNNSCKYVAIKCILLSLEYDVDISGASDSNDRNFIHKIVLAGGNAAKIAEISEKGTFHKTSMEFPSVIQAMHKEDDPSLLEAVLSNFTFALAYVVVPDIYGRIPLHYAALNGSVKITRVLINALKKSSTNFGKRHSTDWIDHEGHSPFMYALLRGHSDLVKEFFELEPLNIDDLTETPIDPPSSAVISASMSNTMPSAPHGSFSWKLYVQKHTPLAIACKFGFSEITKYLVSKGANINFVDENGETPLHLAIKNGHIACAEILLNPPQFIENFDKTSTAKPSLELREKIFLWTPLFLSCIEGYFDCAKLLLKHGASANMIDSTGWTPHEHAIFRGHLDIAALLKPLTDETILQSNQESLYPIDLPESQNESSIKPGVFYGHHYLKDRTMLIITLGSNDKRFKREILEFFDGDSPAYPSLSLTVSSKNAAGEPAIVDLPIKDSLEPVIFYSQENSTRPCLDNVIINFDIQPTFGYKKETLARGSVLVSSIWKGFGSGSALGQTSVPLMSKSLEVIGKLYFELSVVEPFNLSKLSVGSKKTYWKYVETKVIGHRGAGANKAVSGSGNLQIGENTVLSLVTAASLGAEYVEFDVQVTKDKVPVIYHDWILSETGLNISVNSVTAQEFKSLGPQADGIKGAYKRLGNKSDDDFSVKYGSDVSIDKNNYPDHDLLKTYFNKKHHGGRGDHAIKAPFATLEELFKKVPVNTGFNIEVKYPDSKEISENNLAPFELNEFVDAILKCVYDHSGDRKILFSSFHPETCLMLNLKQPNYPVFFLTEAGTAKNYDNRCNSLKDSIRFAKFADLLGIVSVSDPLIEAPHLCRAVKENGLLLFSYGALNNDVKNFELQKRFGVDAVIVDRIKPIVSSKKPK